MSYLSRDRVEEESRGDHRGRRGRSAERQVQHSRSRSRSPPQRPRQQRYLFMPEKHILCSLRSVNVEHPVVIYTQ